MPPQIKDSGLNWHPHARTVLMCNFKGFIVPEITKRRPVVVITPRLQYRANLCTIVPLSTTPPQHPQPFHVRLSANPHPNEPDELPVWAKCDLIANVSMQRLDRFQVGYRRFMAPKIPEDDLRNIRNGVLHGLGFGALISDS